MAGCVHFFLLATTEVGPWLDFACQQLASSYQQRQRCFVHTDSAKMAEQVDEQLWAFQPESFVPHQLQHEGAPGSAPIIIGQGEGPKHRLAGLVVLSEQVPEFVNQFKWVIDVAYSEPHALQAARERYKHYKQLGLPIQYHDCRKGETADDC